MRDITLAQETLLSAHSKRAHGALFDAFKNQAKERLYCTYVQINANHFELTTTSRDVHLMLGLLGKEGIIAMCTMLEAEYGHDLEQRFLISSEHHDLYVVRSEWVVLPESKIIYSISPAHHGRHGGGH